MEWSSPPPCSSGRRRGGGRPRRRAGTRRGLHVPGWGADGWSGGVRPGSRRRRCRTDAVRRGPPDDRQRCRRRSRNGGGATAWVRARPPPPSASSRTSRLRIQLPLLARSSPALTTTSWMSSREVGSVGGTQAAAEEDAAVWMSSAPLWPDEPQK